MKRALSPAALQALEIEAREVAALTGHFTPNEIASALAIPRDDVLRRHALWDVLSRLSAESTDQPDYGWTLLPDARRAGLSSLYAKAQVHRLNEIAPKPHDHDAFGRAMRRLLTRDELALPIPGAKASDKALRSAQRAMADILDAAQFALDVPALADQRYRVRGVSSRSQDMSLAQFISFTKDQITRLQSRRNLAMVLPNSHHGYSGLLDRMSRHLRGVTNDPRPQLLTGIGGAGKSALIARLLQGWSGAGAPVIPVLLDFDRQQLASGEPVEIVTEILRQLSAGLGLAADIPQPQRDEVDDRLDELRQEIALWKRDTEGNVETNLNQLSFLRTSLTRLVESWAAPLRQKPIAIIFDTFEAVDRMLMHFDPTADEEGEAPLNPVISQILELETALRDIAFPNLRSVFSGREPPVSASTIDTYFSRHLRANGLTKQSGSKVLRDEDKRIADRDGVDPILTDAAQRQEISRLLSGHPLALLVFARYAHQHADDVEGLVAELDSEGGFGAALAQRFLYSRILGRIADRQVRKLAHPGLVLRQLNADMIRLVLAEPCLGLQAEEVSDTDAQDLMRRLSGEYWLVEPARGALPLRHRPDLRGLMVRGIFAGPAEDDEPRVAAEKLDLQRKAKMVALRARDYFRIGPAQEDPGHGIWAGIGAGFRELEAQYYDAFLTIPPLSFSREAAAALDKHLGLDLETMPAPWRARIKDALGRALSAGELETLDEADREGAFSRAYDLAEQSGLSKFTPGRFSSKKPRPATGASNMFGEETESLQDLERHIGLSWATANFKAMYRLPFYLRRLIDTKDPEASSNLRNQLWRMPIYQVAIANAATGGQGPEVEPVSEGDVRDHALATAALWFEGGQRDAFYGPLGNHPSVSADAVTSNRRVARDFAGLLALQSDDPVTVRPTGFALGYHPGKIDLDLEVLRDRPGFFAAHMADRMAPPDDLTVAGLERLYRGHTSQDLTCRLSHFSGLSPMGRDWAGRLFRGLTPELHEPTAYLLRATDDDTCARVLQRLIANAPLWPADLKDMTGADVAMAAETIVETADRCGVLDDVLSVLEKQMEAARHARKILRLVDAAFGMQVN